MHIHNLLCCTAALLAMTVSAEENLQCLQEPVAEHGQKRQQQQQQRQCNMEDRAGEGVEEDANARNRRQHDVRGPPGEDTNIVMRWIYGFTIVVTVM